MDFGRYTVELNTHEWQRLLDEAASLGVVHVHFSGGEPLLRADILQIVEKAQDRGLYSNLSTGGTLLTEKLAYELRAPGLDSLQVSIQDVDPYNSDYISRGLASFEKKKKAAILVKNSGFPLTINVDNVDAIISLAEDLGAERLELANTQFNGWALKNRIMLLPTRAQVKHAAAASLLDDVAEEER